jgi:hypothetical protein
MNLTFWKKKEAKKTKVFLNNKNKKAAAKNKIRKKDPNQKKKAIAKIFQIYLNIPHFYNKIKIEMKMKMIMIMIMKVGMIWKMNLMKIAKCHMTVH